MRTALAGRFHEGSCIWSPHLSEYEPAEGHGEEELRLIRSGEIRTVGFVYVGLA